jgi:transcription elongation GreA/GreB family factor
MTKRDLIQAILDRLAAELELYFRAARAAHAEATHEQSKAENKYDTRGLEASYLARGQSRQAAEIAEALKRYEALPVRDFGTDEPIDLGALVEIEMKGEKSCYFMGPCAGGTEIEFEKKEILVITPQSPVGQQLMGKRQGERFTMEIGGARQEYRVKAVR